MSFPLTRMRRLRKQAPLRDMFAETRLYVSDLVMPLFVCEGKGVRQEIASMPGNHRLSVDMLVQECLSISKLGIPAVLLFGVPDEEVKDDDGSCACHEDSIVQRAIRAVKQEVPGLMLMADLCNCEYTRHGHCGTIVDGDVHNDLTTETLARQAVSLAGAGADMLAPSDMMDGRVLKIRQALDAEGFHDIPIMSYAAKYASAFYGPFRDAAGSTPQHGDRKTYQMNPTNVREAIREVQLDIDEGADVVMVKPALSYLDVIWRIKNSCDVPVAAYNVSGEYAMVKAAAKQKQVDEKAVVLEILTSIKRAGADIIITYHAREVAEWLGEKRC